MNLLQNNPDYFQQTLGDQSIVCKARSGNRHDWKIALPDAMLAPLVTWYHQAMAHVEGPRRVLETIQRHFHHSRLRQEVNTQISACEICKRAKVSNAPPRGHLAPRNHPLTPWSEVHIDSIGPWRIKVRGHNLVFKALTCIDPVTNLLEIVPQKSTKAREAAHLFDTCWLSRYPRPRKVVHDNGPEFNGQDFKLFLANAGIDSRPIGSNTPTSNSIIESVHRAVGQVIRTMVHLRPPNSGEEAQRLVESALATAMHATRCASHNSLSGVSPGALVFRRDMFLDLPLLVDLITLNKARQTRIDSRLIRANARRIDYDYQVGDQVRVIRPRRPGDKAQMLYSPPYPIIRIHTNNTVTIQKGIQQQRLSIRRIKLET